jgi:branched-chain amino acid transport system substrate-binding protein
VADESFADAQGDLSAQAARILNSKADVLLLPNFADSSVAAGIAARRAGVKSVFLGSDGWVRRDVRAIPAFDGSFMATNWSEQLDTVANKAFIHAYTRRFSMEPSETAALTYDAARLLFAAIAAANSESGAAIRDALYSLTGFEGTSGPIRYTKSGDPEKPVVIIGFKGGTDTLAQVIAPRGAR